MIQTVKVDNLGRITPTEEMKDAARKYNCKGISLNVGQTKTNDGVKYNIELNYDIDGKLVDVRLQRNDYDSEIEIESEYPPQGSKEWKDMMEDIDSTAFGHDGSTAKNPLRRGKQ